MEGYLSSNEEEGVVRRAVLEGLQCCLGEEKVGGGGLEGSEWFASATEPSPLESRSEQHDDSGKWVRGNPPFNSTREAIVQHSLA